MLLLTNVIIVKVFQISFPQNVITKSKHIKQNVPTYPLINRTVFILKVFLHSFPQNLITKSKHIKQNVPTYPLINQTIFIVKVLLLRQVSEDVGDLLGHVGLDDREPDRLSQRNSGTEPDHVRVQIDGPVAGDVKGGVDEAGDVRGGALGDHALELVADCRTEDKEV